jgi:hypothetical protein
VVKDRQSVSFTTSPPHNPTTVIGEVIDPNTIRAYPFVGGVPTRTGVTTGLFRVAGTLRVPCRPRSEEGPHEVG